MRTICILFNELIFSFGVMPLETTPSPVQNNTSFLNHDVYQDHFGGLDIVKLPKKALHRKNQSNFNTKPSVFSQSVNMRDMPSPQ